MLISNTAQTQALCFHSPNATLQWLFQAFFWPQDAILIKALRLPPVHRSNCSGEQSLFFVFEEREEGLFPNRLLCSGIYFLSLLFSSASVSFFFGGSPLPAIVISTDGLLVQIALTDTQRNVAASSAAQRLEALITITVASPQMERQLDTISLVIEISDLVAVDGLACSLLPTGLQATVNLPDNGRSISVSCRVAYA